MRQPGLTVLDLLRCPETGAALLAEPIRADAAASGEAAALLSGGRVLYPMLFGIPRLLDDVLRPLLVTLLARRRVRAAEALALSWPAKTWGSRVRRRVTAELARRAPGSARLSAALGAGLGRLSDARALGAAHPSFAALVARMDADYLGDWMLHRFAARPFLPLLALAHLAASELPVLEIGGGVGHSTFVLSGQARTGGLVAVDNVFAHLVVARRFLAPGAVFICADAERGLPFPPGLFGAVVMADAFHFVRDQPGLAAEIARVLAASGRVVLSHIHNGRFAHPFSGAAQPPEAYAALFADRHPIIVGNDPMLASLFGTDGIAIDGPAQAGVEGQPSLSLIAPGPGPLRAHVWDDRFRARTRLVLNPLLRAVGGRLCPIAAVSPVVEPILLRPCLPGGGLSAAEVEQIAEGADPRGAIELLRRRVLLDVPRLYL